MSLLQFTFYFSFRNTLVWFHHWVHNTSSRSDWYRPKRTQTLLPPCVRERWGILLNLLESQQTFSRCALPLPASCLIKHVESCSLKSSCLFFWRSLPSLLELCNSKGLKEKRRSVNVELNPLKSDTNTDSVWTMEVSLIDWFFYHNQLVPIDLCCEMVLRKLDWDPSFIHNNWSLGIIKMSIRPWIHDVVVLIHPPWTWCPSWSPAHIPDRRWTCLTTSSWECFVSRWSRSHSGPPLLSLCGPSWHWGVLLQRKNKSHPSIYGMRVKNKICVPIASKNSS